MSVSLLIAGALLAQSGGDLLVQGQNLERVDVAYEELMAGENDEALAKIRASRLDEQGDPSALINLGTAYARLGDRERALDCYESAIASGEHYYLQLADGRWVDSRRAARMAISALADSHMLSLR